MMRVLKENKAGLIISRELGHTPKPGYKGVWEM